ncbi:MAG: GDP-mannose 4,6-dehydratase [Kiritimatiellales bacterium]
MKKAFITGVSGQDGSYLTELLLNKGYEVHGMVRRASSFNRSRLESFYRAENKTVPFYLHYGDMSDALTLHKIIEQTQPDEIYNLAAQSHVQISLEMPEYTTDVNAVGTLRLLSAIRELRPKARCYQASSSELFGTVEDVRLTEKTPFHPRSPYGIAKLYAYWMTAHYREVYGLHLSNGILFNHESPRRGENFVTRKITQTAARIAAGVEDCLYVGNLSVVRDWGYAPDYVKAMWLMLQQDVPDDYVIATGEGHSVREFVEKAFGVTGIHLAWKGTGEQERGVDAESGRVVVQVDPRFYRPTEVMAVIGDATKARQVLGWVPTIGFEQLVRIMVEADCLAAGVLV